MPFEEFYNHKVSNQINLQEDFHRWAAKACVLSLLFELPAA